MIARPELVSHVRRQVEIRRGQGLNVLEALAAVRTMYTEVIMNLIEAEKNVPVDVTAASILLDDWQATLIPGNPYYLDKPCLIP